MRKQFSKFALAATLGLALTFTFSCSSDNGNEPSGGGSCSININDYGTVEFGSQTWLAKNLNCDVSGSVCYDKSETNCSKYGRLYDLNTAKKVCPSGWHLPSNADWNKLVSYVENDSGCSDCAGRLLKATNGWNSNGNGNDKYGFSALPSGYGGSRDDFGDVGDYGYWWSADEGNSDGASLRYMYYNDEDVTKYDNYKDRLFSVRCVKD